MPGRGQYADEPDATTGLTGKQREAIATSWKLVNADAEKHGVELLIRLFKDRPNTQGYFSRFRGMSNDDLRGNKDLISHAYKVMKGVTHMVNNLDNVAVLVEAIKKVATDHQGFGVKSQDFKVVLSLLQSVMKDVLEADYDLFTSESWKTCCEVIWSVIDSELTLNKGQ